MTDLKQLAQRLTPALLSLPDKPSVLRIQIDVDEDTSGEESLEVLVVLANETTDEELQSDGITKIKDTIEDALVEEKVDLFPYFWFAKEEELEQQADRSG